MSERMTLLIVAIVLIASLIDQCCYEGNYSALLIGFAIGMCLTKFCEEY